jgi:uncharacterized protein with von Willebrand factor type A (vWA) domain
MERIVARFVKRLRRRGLRVSPGESIDAVRAIDAAGWRDRDGARSILQLTLVKSQKDVPVFLEVFDAFFGDGLLERLRRDLAAAEQAAAVQLELQRNVARAPSEEGERSGVTLLVDDDAEEDLDLDALEPLDGGGEGGPAIAQQGRYRGEKARDRSRVSRYTEGRIYAGVNEKLLERWSNQGVKPFSPEEQAAMEEVVARMARRLKKDVRRMRSRQAQGRLSVRKTLQKNYRNGMVPFVRVLRRKRKDMPRLVVLCDVSYSVSHASRFLLLLVHTLQRGLLDVRTFVFNREIAEVTALLESSPLNAALELIDGGGLVNLEDHSDFGHAFRTFEQDHLASLRGRPALIVLGDARNNYNEPHDEALEAIRERAGYLMWLTPEERVHWDLGDCLMNVYGPICDSVEVVRNVQELSLVVEQLVRCYYTAVQAPAARQRKAWQHGGVTVRA